eukprot:3602757-Rhodomonas_salina.3
MSALHKFAVPRAYHSRLQYQGSPRIPTPPPPPLPSAMLCTTHAPIPAIAIRLRHVITRGWALA